MGSAAKTKIAVQGVGMKEQNRHLAPPCLRKRSVGIHEADSSLVKAIGCPGAGLTSGSRGSRDLSRKCRHRCRGERIFPSHPILFGQSVLLLTQPRELMSPKKGQPAPPENVLDPEMQIHMVLKRHEFAFTCTRTQILP